MAGSSAPVMYWAVQTALCSALRSFRQTVATQSGDAASQDDLNGAAVELYEDLRAHATYSEGEEALSCPLHNCVGVWTMIMT